MKQARRLHCSQHSRVRKREKSSNLIQLILSPSQRSRKGESNPLLGLGLDKWTEGDMLAQKDTSYVLYIVNNTQYHVVKRILGTFGD